MAAAITHARGIKGTVDGLQTNMEYKIETARPYQIELHKKFSLSLIVLLLFLIAAPLGAIIKKGGIGLPLVISVLLFVLFYAVNLTGEKMGKEGVVPVWLGMWLSSLFLLPIGLFITYQANKDRSWASIQMPWRKRRKNKGA
jgi:lipopolysaccharide export system permease protein